MTPAQRLDVRLDKLAPWLASALVFAVAVWASQPYAVGVFHDDGVYVVLAKALAGGEGFRYLNLPGAPIATHYPPAYPLLLAGLWKLAPVFPENIQVLQLANAVALACTAFGVWVFARHILSWTQPAAMAATLVGTLSYPLLGLSGHLLSETLFAAVLFPSLVLAERAAANGGRRRDVVLAGATAGLLTLVRTLGIALVGATVIVLAFRRKWRHAAIAAIAAAVVLLPWQWFVAAHDREIVGVLRGKYASYVPWLIDGLRNGIGFVGATAVANVREINALLADRFSLSDHALPRLMTGLVAAIFTIAGVFRVARRAPVTAMFIGFYIAILLIWPFTPWRFFYAVWPIVILSFGETIRWLAAERDKSVAASVGLVFASVLALGVVREESRAYRQRSWYQPAQTAAGSVAPMLRWIASNSTPDDVVLVEAEQIVYLFTGRRAMPPQPFTAADYLVRPPIGATTESLREVLSEFPVTLVVTTVPNVLRSARLLSDSAHVPPSSPRLIPVAVFRNGGAFRVQRHQVGNHQP